MECVRPLLVRGLDAGTFKKQCHYSSLLNYTRDWSILTVGYHPLCVELHLMLCDIIVCDELFQAFPFRTCILKWWRPVIEARAQSLCDCKGLAVNQRKPVAASHLVINQQVSKVSLTGVRSGALNWKEGFLLPTWNQKTFTLYHFLPDDDQSIRLAEVFSSFHLCRSQLRSH